MWCCCIFDKDTGPTFTCAIFARICLSMTEIVDNPWQILTPLKKYVHMIATKQ